MATMRGAAGTVVLKDYPGPRGAPTITYVAVSPQERFSDPTARDVVRQNKHTITVEDRQKLEHRYQMEEVFANTKDDDVIYEAMLDTTGSGLAPLHALVKNSVSTCVMVMGSTSSRKKMLYQGDGRADSDMDGVIGWAANKLFEMLEDEQTDPDFRGCMVAASFVEIFDETLIDLLNLEAKGLHLMMDPRDGYQVTPLDKVEVKNYDDVMRVLEHGIKNRNAKKFQEGSAADFSSAVFEFHLMQQRVLRMEDGGATRSYNSGSNHNLAGTVFKTHMADGDEDPVETLISRLVFVEVPCTDDLIESPLELRARHGPYLHRSLLTFADVCKAMADETMQYYAPFAQSRLTHLLQDIFGGNFLVLCLACIAPGEPEITIRTLDLVSTLGKAAHFPNENHEMLQGLLMKYRTELGHLQDRALERDLLESEKRGEEVGEEGEANRRKMQEELSEAHRERNLAKEDALKIYKVLELLKAKYNTVLEEKARQSKELIEAEEAKLKIARSLLELKLEISKLQEDFEKEKYELSSQLLGAKNEMCEVEIKLHDAEDQAAKGKEEAEQAKRERDDMQVELGTLHSNFTSLRNKYNDEKSKTVELGAELLSLVNAHETLGKTKSALEGRVHQQAQRLKELEAALEKSAADTERYATAQREQAKELDELRGEKIKAVLELERATVAFEQSRLQMDKGTADFMRDKDLEVLQTRRNAEEQLRKLQLLNEELERKCQTLEGQAKRESRKVQDLSQDMSRVEEEARALRKERDGLEAELEGVTRKYRRKVVVLLEKDMGHIAAIGTQGGAVNNNKNKGSNDGGPGYQAAAGKEPKVSSAFLAMVGDGGGDKAKQQQQAGPSTQPQQQQQQGGGRAGSISGVSRGGRLSSALAGEGSSSNNKKGDRSPQPVRGAADQNRQGGEEAEYKERKTLVEDLLESYRGREQSLQAQILALRTQTQDLNHKNKGLFNKCRKLLHLLEDVAPQALSDAAITLSPEEDTQLERALREEVDNLRRRLTETDKELAIQQEKNVQLADMYLQALKRLESQKADVDHRAARLQTENLLLRGGQNLGAMRGSLDGNSSSSIAPPAVLSGDDAAQLTMLKQENDHLRKQLRHARAQPAVPAAGAIHPHHHHHHHHLQQHQCKCNPKCPCVCKASSGRGVVAPPGGGSTAASSGLMAQLQEAEKRYANLMSKCAMLEEESSSYKQHMQGVVGRYQTQLQRNRLQQQQQQEEGGTR